MDIELNKKMLIQWDKLFLIDLGASSLFLVSTILGFLDDPARMTGWATIWLFLQIAAILPVVIFLLSRAFRRMSIAMRLKPIFKFVLLSWIILFSLSLKGIDFEHFGWLGVASELWLISAVGLLLLIAYWFLRRRFSEAGEIFS